MASMAFCQNLFRLKVISSKIHFAEYDICLNSSKSVQICLKCLFFRLNFVYTYNGKEKQVLYEG